MLLTESPLVTDESIQIGCRILDINTVNQGKLVRIDLDGWGKFYEDVYGWQANFESPGRGA